MKRVIALMIAMILCFTFLVSCGETINTAKGSGGANETAGVVSNAPDGGAAQSDGGNVPPDGGKIVSAKDTLSVAITQDGGTLDPIFLYMNDFQPAMGLVYDTLWALDANNEFVWRLATGVDRTDPLKWIITLRDNVYFANGNKFTASDVLFSLYRVEHRKGEPSLFGNIIDFEASRVIDDKTVEVDFISYDIKIVYNFAGTYIFDEESFDDNKVAMETNGTGPYVVSDYVVNSHIELTRRDGYWGTPPPIKNITFRILTEEAQRVNALQTGEVDIAAVPFQDIEYVQTLPNAEVIMIPTTTTSSLWMNTNPAREGGVFANNLDARLAVAHAIDPNAILKVAYNGYARLGRAPYSSAVPDVFPELLDKGIYDGHGYDPALAKQYAEKAGIVGKTVVLINNGSPTNVTICELVHGFLKDIGVNVEIRSYDMGSWLAVLFDGSAWDMCIDFTAGNTVAEAITFWWGLQAAYDYKNPDSTSRYPGKERLIELASDIMSLTDQEELNKRYIEMTDILNEAMLYFTLVETVAAQAYNPNLNLPRLLYGAIDYRSAYWVS